MMNYDVKKMYEWPRSIRMVVLCLCVIILLFLGYFMDLSPMQSQIVSDDQQVEDAKQQLEMMLNKQVSIANNITQLPKMKAILKDWQQRIVDKSEFPGLLDTILKYGESNNLKFNNFGPSTEIKAGIYTKVPIKIEMTGTYDEIATFLSQVANMQKMILIDDFTIIKQGQMGASSAETFTSLTSDQLLTGELTLEIYRK